MATDLPNCPLCGEAFVFSASGFGDFKCMTNGCPLRFHSFTLDQARALAALRRTHGH